METTETNTLLLKKFITEFLPITTNQQKYTHNEYSFIHTTISKIFLHHLNIKITDHHLAKTFTELGYIYLVQEGQAGLLKNKNKRSKKKKKPPTPFFDLPNYVFVYLLISSKTAKELKQATNSILYLRNPQKIILINNLKQKLTTFFHPKPLP